MAAIKCECPKQCEIHPRRMDERGEIIQNDPSAFVNELSLEDKLALRDLEARWMRAKLQASDAITQANQALDQLNIHARTLNEKYGIDPSRFILSMPELKFVPVAAIPRG